MADETLVAVTLIFSNSFRSPELPIWSISLIIHNIKTQHSSLKIFSNKWCIIINQWTSMLTALKTAIEFFWSSPSFIGACVDMYAAIVTVFNCPVFSTFLGNWPWTHCSLQITVCLYKLSKSRQREQHTAVHFSSLMCVYTTHIQLLLCITEKLPKHFFLSWRPLLKLCRGAYQALSGLYNNAKVD